MMSRGFYLTSHYMHVFFSIDLKTKHSLEWKDLIVLERHQAFLSFIKRHMSVSAVCLCFQYHPIINTSSCDGDNSQKHGESDSDKGNR